MDRKLKLWSIVVICVCVGHQELHLIRCNGIKSAHWIPKRNDLFNKIKCFISFWMRLSLTLNSLTSSMAKGPKKEKTAIQIDNSVYRMIEIENVNVISLQWIDTLGGRVCFVLFVLSESAINKTRGHNVHGMLRMIDDDGNKTVDGTYTTHIVTMSEARFSAHWNGQMIGIHQAFDAAVSHKHTAN